MNDINETFETRFKNAEKILDSYKDDEIDVDTVIALSILESKKPEIKHMLSKSKYFHRYERLIDFLKTDNPYFNEKIINRYIFRHYHLIPNEIVDTTCFIFIFFVIPMVVDIIMYHYFQHSPDIIALIFATTCVTFFVIVFIGALIQIKNNLG